MPSRLLREGILDSEAVNSLSYPAEVFYRRLMSVVDDFGRFDGRPAYLRSRLYPLKVESVREADILRWMAECQKAELIALFACDRAGSPRWIAACEKAGLSVSGDEKPYILFHRLGPPRAKDSKYPPPPDGPVSGCEPAPPAVDGCFHPFTDENNRVQTPADVPYSYSGSDAFTKEPPNPPPGGGSVVEPVEEKPPRRSRKTPVADASTVPIPAELDQPAFRAAWASWLDYRRHKGTRFVVTADGARIYFKRLVPLGVAAAVDCIETAIANGWQGMFPDRATGSFAAAKPPAKAPTVKTSRDNPLILDPPTAPPLSRPKESSHGPA